ncbi:MAG: XdhC family protein [Candidatus Nanopelagicales bacterium]
MAGTTIVDRAEALRSQRVPFVHARVVLAERPTSAKPGDEALVLADGSIEGFVGGSCAESTVRLHGLALLERGESELLRIAPVAEPDQPGKTVVHNPCLSGGTLEIFLEPVLPVPLVRVHGRSPIVAALERVGRAMGYDVAAETGAAGTGAAGTDGAAPADSALADAVVVAAHGLIDEEAVLRAALDAGVPYIALVASPRRGNAVLDAMGLAPEDRARVKTPAGLDIGARTSGEIAVSILAELVARRAPQLAQAEPPTMHAPAGARTLPLLTEEVAVPVAAVADGAAATIDPVCGMTVVPTDSTPHSEVDGVSVWFCCPGCKRAFDREPGKYPLR